jgi:CheY-like chemotaxis protein
VRARSEPESAPDTVLVVDDTPSKRYLLASWLRRGGFAVIEASTGAEALRTVAGGGIDLVVLDVRLPDMTGFEVCQQIKDHHAPHPLPVMHVSAAAVDSVDRTQGLQGGADAYLVEPIDPDELLATAASILRYYQARQQAEQLASRMTGLTRLGLDLAAATTDRAVLAEAAAGGARIFQSRIAIVATGDDGARLVASCTGPNERAVLRESTAPVTEEPVGITIRDESGARWRRAGWPDSTAVRVLVLRQRVERPPLYIAVPTRSTMPGNPVLMLFGQQLATALDATRTYAQEHHLALTLQHSLLPQTLPPVTGYDLAVRYLPASETAEIGGDFYEAIRLDGTLMVAVGDVGGHSLHAATIMAELRHATRAYLAEGHSPAGVLDRLNSLMCRLMPGETATMCLVGIDLADGGARFANAGHPPPVLRTRAGTRLIQESAPLLGIRVRPPTETVLTLEPDDLLVLYTDGLVETRTEPIDVNLARLVDAVARAEPDLEAFASRVLREVGPPVANDDIAMVALRRAPAAAEGSPSWPS